MPAPSSKDVKACGYPAAGQGHVVQVPYVPVALVPVQAAGAVVVPPATMAPPEGGEGAAASYAAMATQPQHPRPQRPQQAGMPACLVPGLVPAASDPDTDAYMRSMEARMLAAAMPEHYED